MLFPQGSGNVSQGKNNVKFTLQVNTQTIQAGKTMKMQLFIHHHTDEQLFGLFWLNLEPRSLLKMS